MPFGMIRAESQRDSAPKPRVASRELPWEKRVVSANGVASWWRTGDTTPLGLKIARTLTQGSLADSACWAGGHNPFEIAEPPVFPSFRTAMAAQEISERHWLKS